ncbi:hypothetical protein PHJA_002103000 [Phtheirospermum japonicum]|uniref:Uncharacterized protein n=1 Tax=Phtheirospermum japonicum TaxID=374723 RepID=A0A830CKR5_9LAMI|nr:hypothetical protein PHJA_002103000 [Phtheirospermum japonicum]
MKKYEATRILDEEEEQWMKREQNLLLPSLQRRPVRPPAPNGCTWIPGSGGRPCTAATITEQHFAGKSSPHPPAAGDAYPGQGFEFGVATQRK